MSDEKSLKARNTPTVILFIAWCLALYIGFQTGPQGFWNRVRTTFAELRLDDGMFLVMAPILALVATGLLSGGAKAVIVFWRLKNVLPGHRAFSVIAHRDPRLDRGKLTEVVGELPVEPREQNTKWYEIFRRHQAATIVEQSHRSYLLARDLATTALLFGVLGTVALLLVQREPGWSLVYAAVMLAQYALLAVVARNHGNALVANALAEEITAGLG